MTIKYGSLCSGIEAATVAWHDLGWQPQFFSDIEKFPNAVLNHHYPNVTNHGDMTNFGDWPDESINLLVGGTPCQSFSVAGLRGGLDDPRGNLALTYLAIAERYAPRWLVWENVPGVLSSRGGRDFGSFLGALGKLGYGFAYRVLDAQFFGVAQRRRRVFVIGYLGDWRRAATVLFERESRRRDTAPSREEGQEAAKTITAGVGQRYDFESENFPIAFGWQNSSSQGASVSRHVTPTLDKSKTPAVAGTFTSHSGMGGWSIDEAYAGHIVPAVAGTLSTTGGWGVDEACASHVVSSQKGLPRRITPTEAERLQGFPDGYTDIYDKTPDTPRYKALGNSMAVPVMKWIGSKIDKVDKYDY
jgi:DNA (cytosine-5)-methyltransferase 1